MSRSNEFKEQGFACRCSVTDSQFGDLAASVPSPVELVSLVFACPLPRCEIERNAGSCRADPTRSARWPARVNLAAFWQQIAPSVPFLPTLPTAKHCTVCYLQIAAHLDTEEVAGSNPVVPTISHLKSVDYRFDLVLSHLLLALRFWCSEQHLASSLSFPAFEIKQPASKAECNAAFAWRRVRPK